MAITKLLGMEHLPQDFYGSIDTGYGLINAGLDLRTYWGSGSEASGNVCGLRTKDGKLLFGKRPVSVVASSCAGKATIPFSRLIGGAGVKPNKITIGFRCQRYRAPVGAYPVFAISTDRDSAQPYGGYHDLVIHNVADALTTIYYEIELDFVAKTVRQWQDNTPIGNPVALNAGITKDNIASFFWQIGTIAVYLMSHANDDPTSVLSDIYVTTDTGIANDPYAGRLGPITLMRAPVLSADSAAWPTSNGAAIPAVLNTRRNDGATMNAPYISNDAGNTPLKLKFDVSAIPLGASVKGVSLSVTPFREVSGGTQLNVGLKYNADVTSLLDVSPAVTTPGADTNLGVLSKLPGGAELTKAGLAAAELVFTPT